MQRAVCVLACMLVWLLSVAGAGAAEQAPAHIHEPPAYGHTVGGLLLRQVQLAPGQQLEPQALPDPGRVDSWFELRSATLHGSRLQLHYQLINAPQKVATLALPALQLPLAGGHQLALPEWPVVASPLTAQTVLSRAGLPVLQPDIRPQPPPQAPLHWRVALWATLALLACAWLALRRHPEWAPWRRRAPFAAALPPLKRLVHDGQDEQACRCLHRAFDQAAGGALFGPGLAPWLAQRPGLAPLAADIQAFFAATERGFFDTGSPLPAAAQVLALARRLARVEGRGA